MNSFGLGLVLNFVDNASAGMNSASQTFNQMSAMADSMTSSVSASATEMTAIAYSLSAVGDTFIGIGSSITGVFSNLTQQVIDSGMSMQGYRMQLSALYGSMEAGEAKIEEIKQYAMSSVFDIQSLIPAVTMMKAVGIEAMQEVTTSSGSATQKLLDYASDIAAMVPNMRNTYGTGVAAAMGAMKEYIAEGNAMTLKRGAGLDITGILGEDKGATMEERTQQVADLVDKLNIVGYTANLAGTPTQRLSNMQDALFNSLTKIADSGVFEVYCGLLEKLSNWVFSLVEDEETFNTITGILADTISTLLSPLESMLDWVIANSNAIIGWIKEHPKLTKTILVVVAAIGAFLVVGGSLLKMLSSVAFAMSGLKMLKSLPSMLSMAGTAFKSLISTMLPFVALAAIAYFVWKNNIFNIKGVITDAVGKIKDVVSLVGEAWEDNTLSEESFLRAKNLGILPFIEALLQLKYYWGYFVEGFKTGFKEFFQGITKALSWIKIFNIDIYGITESVGGFLKKLLGIGAEDTWKAIGQAVGKIAGLALSFFAVFKALKLISGLSSGLSGLGNIPLLGGLFGGKKGTKSSDGLLKNKGILSNPKAALKAMTSLGIIIGGATILITAIGALMKVPGLTECLSKGISVLVKLFESIIPITVGAGALVLLVALLDKLKVSPMDAVKGIANIAIILGGFDILITAIGALATIPGFSDFINNGVTTMKSLFEAMSVFASVEFFAMLVAVVALGALGPAIVAMGIAGLAIVIAGLGLIVSAFGALAMIPGFNDFIESGGETLALLLKQIGIAVGSLIGGFGEGITNSLPTIGENLSAFASNLEPFFTTIKNAPVDEVETFLTSFASAMLMLGAEELLSFFTGGIDLVGMGFQLSQFGLSAQTFFETVSQYPEEGISKAVRVMQALGSVGGYNMRTGGVAQFFTGEVDLANIGKQLADFAPYGNTFFNAVVAYSEEGLKKSPLVFEALAGIGDYDFKTGGVAQFFTGTTALDTIGEQLASFAPHGETFFNTAANYNEQGMEKTPKVFEALAGMGDYDFKMGGVAQFFTGTTSFDAIGEQLAAFAPHGATFFSAVADYSLLGLIKSKRVFEAISNIGAYEFKTGGLAQLFTGGTDLGNMGEQLTEFGVKAAGFFVIAAKYPDKGIANGKVAVDMLGVIGNSDLKSGGLMGLFTGSFDIVSIGKQLASFGAQAYIYFTSVENLSMKAITNGNKVINALKDIGSASFRSGGLLQFFIGEVDITNLANNLSKFGTGSKTFFNVANELPETCFDKAKQLFNALSTMGQLDGIDFLSKDTALSTLGKELVLFIASSKVFFIEAGNLNAESVKNITTALGPFFETIMKFDTSKLPAISSGFDGVSTSTVSLSDTLSTTVTDITTNSESIVSALTTCAKDSKEVLNELSSSGTNVGYNLMLNIAKAITANAYLIRNAVQNAVDSITITLPDIANTAGNKARGQATSRMVGLSTGGYVKTTGIAVLHPNEVVVNDDITKRLRNFLGSVEESQASSSILPANNTTVVNNTSLTTTIPSAPVLASPKTTTGSENTNHNDYSVTFAAGSVVIQVNSASSDEDLEKAAEKLMNIIARKQQLRDMAIRK